MTPVPRLTGRRIAKEPELSHCYSSLSATSAVERGFASDLADVERRSGMLPDHPRTVLHRLAEPLDLVINLSSRAPKPARHGPIVGDTEQHSERPKTLQLQYERRLDGTR